MKVSRILQISALLCVASLASLAAASDEAEMSSAVQQKPCCFENPRYSGTCEVTPGPDESCGDILAYLNNPNSVGKNYCGNTKVRGGWSQVPCGEAASAGSSCQGAVERE